MEKYTRIDIAKSEEPINKNEIRVTTQGKMRRYISYATSLLQDKQCEEITLKAMGKAINKTVSIAEIIKRRIPGLHQITEIDSTDIKETYTPNEEGLDRVETTRHVSSILISLSTREPDTSAIGYQPPIPDTEVKSSPGYSSFPRGETGGRGRGSGRTGGRGHSRGRGRFSSNGNGPPSDDVDSQLEPETAPPLAERSTTESIPEVFEPIRRGEDGYRGRGLRRGGGRGRGRGRGGRRGGRGAPDDGKPVNTST